MATPSYSAVNKDSNLSSQEATQNGVDTSLFSRIEDVVKQLLRAFIGSGVPERKAWEPDTRKR